MSKFCNICVPNSIRTNSALPSQKSTILPQFIKNETVEYYVYIKNYREQAYMRRRRMELAYVCLLPAVPKAWRATLALTHCPAVEPLRWVLRGIGGSAIVLGSFFKYLLPIGLQTDT
jgi:hypothetical protein